MPGSDPWYPEKKSRKGELCREERSSSDRERKEELREIRSERRLEGSESLSRADIWGKNLPGRESSESKGFRMGVSPAGSSDSPEAPVAGVGEQRSEGWHRGGGGEGGQIADLPCRYKSQQPRVAVYF